MDIELFVSASGHLFGLVDGNIESLLDIAVGWEALIVFDTVVIALVLMQAYKDQYNIPLKKLLLCEHGPRDLFGTMMRDGEHCLMIHALDYRCYAKLGIFYYTYGHPTTIIEQNGSRRYRVMLGANVANTLSFYVSQDHSTLMSTSMKRFADALRIALFSTYACIRANDDPL